MEADRSTRHLRRGFHVRTQHNAVRRTPRGTCPFAPKTRASFQTRANSPVVNGAGAPEKSCIPYPPKERACGTPDAQRIRSPVCKSEKHTSVVTTNTPKTSGVPHAMGYGLLRDLPGDRSSCFVTVVATEDVSLPGWAGLSGATFANVRASGPHDLGRPGNVVVSASSATHGPFSGKPPCCLIRA